MQAEEIGKRGWEVSDIPEDLKALYAECQRNLENPEHDSVHMLLQSEVILIERIAKAEAQLKEREQEIERLKRDGWYLVSADRPVEWLGGSCFQRNGEPNSSANCASWYESAVYWRNQAEKAEAQVAALGKPVTDEEWLELCVGTPVKSKITECFISRRELDEWIRSRITKDGQ